MMNPSAWCNPPPPGLDMDEESKHSNVSSAKSYSGLVLDQIDPFIKNPDYIKYKQSAHHRRSRSHSFDKYKSRSRSKERRRKNRSRSRSRGRYRRSRSRSRNRRHRRYSHSSSRSRSRSPSQARHRYKHKRKKSRRSRSRSRSFERRRHERKYNEPRQTETFVHDNDLKEEEEEPDTKENAFKNDGSFLEMFKKMQEAKAEAVKSEVVVAPIASSSEVKKPLPAFGKRRGGRILKTGMVEKAKVAEDDELANATDPWSIYLKEVKRYKEACCDDDSKTRPLVK